MSAAMKKYISLLILSLAIFPYAQSQTAEVHYDTTHRPRNFHLQLAQFKSYPDAKTDIIFLGNSLTAGIAWNELLDEPNARNRGISGDTSYGIIERLEEVVEGKPAKIFLLIGINDIARNFPANKIIENHHKIVQQIQKSSPNTLIYLQTLLPVNNSYNQFPNHYNKDQTIAAVNQGLKGLAEAKNLELVDLYPHFLDKQARLNKIYTHDGLHLNAQGYKLWAEVLRPHLQ